jgi:hypothetical protein
LTAIGVQFIVPQLSVIVEAQMSLSIRYFAITVAVVVAVEPLHFKASNAADSKCLEYGPAIVTLTGTIIRHMEYGPPNYGEDPAHDAKELYWYLQLDDPICVNGKKEYSQEMEEEKNVRKVQIVYLNGYPKGDNWINHRASITGTLFHAITGHHHTKVLIEARKTGMGA